MTQEGSQMDYKVLKADDGRIAVQSEFFTASCRHGEWVNEMVFDPFELMEMPAVENQDEAKLIVNIAKKSLNRW